MVTFDASPIISIQRKRLKVIMPYDLQHCSIHLFSLFPPSPLPTPSPPPHHPLQISLTQALSLGPARLWRSDRQQEKEDKGWNWNLGAFLCILFPIPEWVVVQFFPMRNA